MSITPLICVLPNCRTNETNRNESIIIGKRLLDTSWKVPLSYDKIVTKNEKQLTSHQLKTVQGRSEKRLESDACIKLKNTGLKCVSLGQGTNKDNILTCMACHWLSLKILSGWCIKIKKKLQINEA